MKLNTIKHIYRQLNQDVFANVLVEPVILSKRWRNAWAQYVTGNNTPSRLEFNSQEIKTIEFATAIVYHEMIHQYVEEYLELDEDNYHGPIFWRNYKIFAPEKVELSECL